MNNAFMRSIVFPMFGSLNYNSKPSQRVLHAYLLGRVDFEAILAFQRRLVFDVSGDRSSGILLLCEHSEAITIGREGSIAHLLLDAEEYRNRQWPIRWVNRGGGCLLHAPGQLAAYSVVTLDPVALNLQEYLNRIHSLLSKVLKSLDIPAEERPDRGGIWVGDRRIAHVGVAVRDWVTYFGFTINIDPDLEQFRWVHCDGEARPMTSIERERRLPIRPTAVRQRILEAFQEAFAFDRVSVFHHHPVLAQKVAVHAVVNRPA
jgi:lipoyl(octanoyl) transferase